jgi:hypothetical protein
MGPGDSVQPGAGTTMRGTVTFLDGPTPLGSPVPVTPMAGLFQGTAQITTTALAAASHTLTASYSGDQSFDPVLIVAITVGSMSAPVTEVVNAPVPVLAPPPVMDVTARVSVSVRRGLPGNQQLVSVMNTSGQTLDGPLYLVLTKLPKKARLRGAKGITTSHSSGSPFLTNAVTLLPGGYAIFLVPFSGHKAVHFTAQVFAGPATP